MLRTIEKFKDPVIASLVVFLLGVIDIIVTVAVILSGLGVEASPYYNWIQPSWLMFAGMAGYNLFLGILFIVVLKVGEKYPLYLPAYAYGGLRLLIGVGSGVMILTGYA